MGRSFTFSGTTLSTADSPPPDQDPWADAIASATQHVRTEESESDEGRSAEAPTKGRKMLLVAVGVLVTVGIALGVQEITRAEPAALPPATQAADLRQEASALIDQIEAYRTERGALPDPSLLSPYLSEGYEYHVVDEEEGRYVVRRTAGGVTVTYDGTLPLGLWVLIGGSSAGNSS